MLRSAHSHHRGAPRGVRRSGVRRDVRADSLERPEDGASKAVVDTVAQQLPARSGVHDQAGRDLRSPDAIDAAQHRGLYASDPDALCSTGTTARPTRSTPRRGRPTGARMCSTGLRLARRGRRRAGPAAGADPRPRGAQRALGGFDWGDAGIGAAGMLALFSIAGGAALLLTGRKRRHGIAVVTLAARGGAVRRRPPSAVRPAKPMVRSPATPPEQP